MEVQGRHPDRLRARLPDGLVEMAWDPITRSVGSLGIYTKIDFRQRRAFWLRQRK